MEIKGWRKIEQRLRSMEEAEQPWREKEELKRGGKIVQQVKGGVLSLSALFTIRSYGCLSMFVCGGAVVENNWDSCP